MSYTINLTDNSIFATVSDGTINTDSSVTIIGKNYAGYGEFLGENFIRMLENSANTSGPGNPLMGQLWFDSASGILKVYNGTIFKNLGVTSTGNIEPTSPVTGDIWFDPINSQLNVYDGTNWIFVGGSAGSGIGASGAIVEVITDDIATDHVVTKFYIDGDVVAIVSKDVAFTPATPILGFAPTIRTGIQLATIVDGNTPFFDGIATDTQLLNGIPSTGFLSTTANDTTVGTLGILNNGGLSVGVGSDILLNINGSIAQVRSVTANNDLSLQINDGTSIIDVIVCDGTSGKATVTVPILTGHITNKDYVDTAITSAIAGTMSDIVDDTTPQLGGMLDVNGFSLGDGTLALLNFSESGSAVNEFTIANAATGSGPVLFATGSDTNIGINITPKGTSKTVIDNIEAALNINTQSGTTYTGVLADAEKVITLNNASAITMTIPANGSVAYPIGTKLNFMQLGVGQVTVTITTDTLDVEGGLTLKLRGQHATATAFKITSTTWVLFGNLEAA